VRNVLNIANAASPVAENIIQSMLTDDPRFERTEQGRWRTVEVQPADKTLPQWILCKIFPPRISWQAIAEIRCARFANGAVIDEMYLSGAFQNQDDAQRLRHFIGDTPLILDGIGNQLTALRHFIAQHTGEYIENTAFRLTTLLGLLFPGGHFRSSDDLAQALQLPALIDASSDLQFNAFLQQAEVTIKLLRENGIIDVEALQQFYGEKEHPPDFSLVNFDADLIHNAPQTPGVYLMRTRDRKVIYVGKAKNLRRRLKDYFGVYSRIDDKLGRIREQVYDIEFIKTGSELEALLLENRLIKEYQPGINRQIKVHSRSFLERQRFPQIVVLPAAEENDVSLLLFNPSRALVFCSAKNRTVDKSIAQKIKTVFFTPQSSSFEEEEEIVTSWLSQHYESTSRIDMRLAPSPEEALRLVQAQVRNFVSDEADIQI